MNLRCIQYALRYASLSQLAVFKWWVVGCGSKTEHQDDMYVDEIGLLAQHLLTVLGSIVNIVGRTLWSFNEPEKLHLRQSYELQKLKKNGYSYNLRLSIISHWLCVSYPSRSGCRAKRSIQGPLTSHICFQDIPLLIWRPQSTCLKICRSNKHKAHRADFLSNKM